MFGRDDNAYFVFTFPIAVGAFAKVGSAIFKGKKVFVDLPSRDAAEGKPGGELSAVVGANGTIAL